MNPSHDASSLPPSSNSASEQIRHAPPLSTPDAPAHAGKDPTEKHTPQVSSQRWKIYLMYLLFFVACFAAGSYLTLELRRVLDTKQAQARALLQDNALLWKETQAQSQKAVEGVQKLDLQLAQINNQIEQIKTQQKAFDDLYQTFARDRERLTLIETRRMLETANEQLSLTGNISLARFALEGALMRLRGLDSIKVKKIRAAFMQDLAAFEAVPVVDPISMAALLDTAYKQIDTLPLAGEVRLTSSPSKKEDVASPSMAKVTPAAPTSSTAPPATSQQATGSNLKSMVEGIWDGFLRELHALVQVRRIDYPDAMRVSPQEGDFLRENLKLRLLSARLALLARNDAVLTADLQAVDFALTHYFDPASTKTQLVRSYIEKINSLPKSSTLPNLKNSLEAIDQ